MGMHGHAWACMGMHGACVRPIYASSRSSYTTRARAIWIRARARVRRRSMGASMGVDRIVDGRIDGRRWGVDGASMGRACATHRDDDDDDGRRRATTTIDARGFADAATQTRHTQAQRHTRDTRDTRDDDDDDDDLARTRRGFGFGFGFDLID